MGGIADDYRDLDPVAYVRALGLQPEDSYGFVPMSLDSDTCLYLYRDRPEYEERRPKLEMTIQQTQQGPVAVSQGQRIGAQAENPNDIASGMLGGLIQQAQEMQKAYGGAQAPMGAPGDAVSTPDPEKLVRLAKLRESGAISAEEYQKLVSEAAEVKTTPAGESTGAPTGGPDIVAQRIYPGVRTRSSTRQLNRFLPSYVETVGLVPEDVYGVYPFGTRTSASTGDSTGNLEWDDFWIVYRDRPEYEAGRDAYAKEMDKKGRWPDPVIAPGIGEPQGSSGGPGKVKVEKDGWPRKALVMKQKNEELAKSVLGKIEKWGFEPEASYGFCPSFAHRAIYFGWRE